MAILRRRLTGRSIFTTDRGHLHHCLLHRGYSCRIALLAIAMLCTCTAIGAVTSVALQHDLIAAGMALGVTGLMAATRFFGYAECSLFCRRMKAFALSLLPVRNGADGHSRQLCTHLQGMQRWDELWQTLTIYAEQFDLTAVQLNVNVPSIHEEYHASWNRKVSPDEARLCNTEIPLMARDRTVGRIKITVDPLQRDSTCSWMSELIAGLKPFESHLLSLLAEPAQVGAAQEFAGAETPVLRPATRWTPRAAEVYASASLAVASVEMAPR